jgi:hypothetical protein
MAYNDARAPALAILTSSFMSVKSATDFIFDSCRGRGKMWRLFFFLAWVVLLLPDAARGQVVYQGCTTPNGQPIPSIADTSVSDIAISMNHPQYGPIIVYNPIVANRFSRQFGTFFYMHECAHHVLGHTYSPQRGMGVEQQADCWAIRMLVGRGIFRAPDMAVVQQELSNASTGSWQHLPGPQRAINLQQCLR